MGGHRSRSSQEASGSVRQRFPYEDPFLSAFVAAASQLVAFVAFDYKTGVWVSNTQCRNDLFSFLSLFLFEG